MSDDSNDPAQKGIEQFDLTLGMDFSLDPEDIQALTNDLNEAEDYDAESADDETLAEYAAALKELQDAAEDARKNVFEDALDERTDIDDEVGPLVKRRGGRRYVADEDAVITSIEEAGGDPTEAMSLKASAAAEQLEALGIDTEGLIEKSEYSYFRRRS